MLLTAHSLSSGVIAMHDQIITWRRPSRVLGLSKLKVACRRRSRWVYNPRSRLDKTGARIGDESDGHRANAPIQVSGSLDAHGVRLNIHVLKTVPNRTSSDARIAGVDHLWGR
jgi:hypothetical protein